MDDVPQHKIYLTVFAINVGTARQAIRTIFPPKSEICNAAQIVEYRIDCSIINAPILNLIGTSKLTNIEVVK